jgi:RNA polymerase sigma factor (sigma-70 family)
LFPMISSHGYPLESVYEPLFPVLYRVAYRMVGRADQAEDICQEAFLRYLQRARPMPDLAQAKYWLIRVVRNLSLNLDKRRGREARAYTRAGRLGPQYEDAADVGLEREETRGEVQRALGRLPHGLRMVLVLKEYASLNYREIGSIMKISEGNVKVRVFRARERLARELELDQPRGADRRQGGEANVP